MSNITMEIEPMINGSIIKTEVEFCFLDEECGIELISSSNPLSCIDRDEDELVHVIYITRARNNFNKRLI